MIKLEPGQLVKFKAAAANVGAVTIQRRKMVPVRHATGEPVRGGDIKVGQAFSVDPLTGIIKIEDD